MHHFITELATFGQCVTEVAYEKDFGPIRQYRTNLQIKWEQDFIW